MFKQASILGNLHRNELKNKEELENLNYENNLPFMFKRLYEDNFEFGIKLITGESLYVRTIDKFWIGPQNNLWIDVELYAPNEGGHDGLTRAFSDRTTATINVAHIVWMFELAHK